MRLLGIDFGIKKVGLALSDEEGSMAFPYTVLENNKNLLQNVSDVVKKEKIDQIIIGHSLNYEGTDNPIMNQARAFSDELNAETKIPIKLEPETLTTVEARRIQGQHKNIDASAAALILNSFIERNSYGKNIN